MENRGKLRAPQGSSTDVLRIQVLGQIAVHHPGSAPNVLTGTSRQLLALLVAVHATGISSHDLAQAFWPNELPASPRIAIRFAIQRLQQRLPQGWTIQTSSAGAISLEPGSGWVDAWRLESIADRPSTDGLAHQSLEPLTGTPYGGKDLGIPLVTLSAARLLALQARVFKNHSQFMHTMSGPFASVAEADAFLRMRTATRLVVTSESRQTRQRVVDRALTSHSAYETHRILGDRRYHAPLVGVASAFGAIRNELLDLDDHKNRSLVPAAWRILVEHLTLRTTTTPQRVVVEDAHLLDPDSLRLIELLLRYHIPRPLRVLVTGDQKDTSQGWPELQAMAREFRIETLHLDATNAGHQTRPDISAHSRRTGALGLNAAIGLDAAV